MQFEVIPDSTATDFMTGATSATIVSKRCRRLQALLVFIIMTFIIIIMIVVWYCSIEEALHDGVSDSQVPSKLNPNLPAP